MPHCPAGSEINPDPQGHSGFGSRWSGQTPGGQAQAQLPVTDGQAFRWGRASQRAQHWAGSFSFHAGTS